MKINIRVLRRFRYKNYSCLSLLNSTLHNILPLYLNNPCRHMAYLSKIQSPENQFYGKIIEPISRQDEGYGLDPLFQKKHCQNLVLNRP